MEQHSLADESPPQPPTVIQRAIVGEVMLTQEQLADYLQVDIMTIYRWRRLFGLPSHQVQRAVRFDLSEVRKWFAQNGQNISAE